MVYAVPSLSASGLAELEAQNEVTRVNQFREQAVKNYIAAYEHFWNIRDKSRTLAQVQAKLDALGNEAVNILSDSATYASAIIANWPGDLPDLYHSSPYTTDTETTPGRVIVGAMVPGWVTELGL